MDKFCERPRCDKCGGEDEIDKMYYEATSGGRMWGRTYDPMPEHLAMTCRFCGYTWNMEVRG